MKFFGTLVMAKVARSLDSLARDLHALRSLYELDLRARHAPSGQVFYGNLTEPATTVGPDHSSVSTVDRRLMLAYEEALERFEAIKGRGPTEGELDDLVGTLPR